MSETAAGWAAPILFAALVAYFNVMGAARTRAEKAELEPPHAVPASRNSQRREARAVGRLYSWWALLASAVTVVIAIPVWIVFTDFNPAAPVSWQRCALVVVDLLWLAAAVRTWVRARRLLKADWLS